jgi:ABC-type multidrug transport system ATPase subunit/pSer/pThr/pTyr-binding forkhead associated (FHA) protein
VTDAPPEPLRVITQRGEVVFPPGPPVIIGRDTGISVVLTHEKVSRRHLTIAYEAGNGWVATDASSNGTFRDGTRVGRFVLHGPVTLMLGNPVTGERIDLALGRTPIAPPIHVAPMPGAPAPLSPPAGLLRPGQMGPGPMPAGGPILPAGAVPMNPSLGSFSMVYQPDRRTRIGRATDNDIVVADLLASRHHAELTTDGRGNWFIEDLGSFNGTYVNGQRIVRKAPIMDGAVISVAHHMFYLSQGRLEEYVDDGRVNLTALGIVVTAGQQRLLDEISFNLERCSLLAILGPTGAGKSTIMRVLTGTQPPAGGTVFYNGRNLYQAYDELRYRIGYVPQDDILHSQLPVRRALSYAAQLRFPPDVSAADRNQRVDEVMAELGLTARANLAVSKLSGGQRKRTSVALELLTRPSLLSLDEPTSGLDPGYERQVMTLLRDLAQAGRTVITVTHNTESLDLCDRLLFLAPGGQVAYFGPPNEAREFFGTEHYPEVFTHLEEAPSGVAKQAYAASPKARVYLDEPLRRQFETAPPPMAPATTTRPARVPSASRQLVTLTRRYTKIISSDVRNTLLLLIQAPALGLLMLLAFGSNGLLNATQLHDQGLKPSPVGGGTVLLALILGASYLGAGNAVREIVKERAILARERAAGLSAGAYLISKALVLGVLTIIQSTILVLLGTARQGGLDDGAVIGSGKLELIVVASATGLAAMALGLMISALVTNPDKALTILPVILLAQFLLSGALFNVAGNPILKPLSYVTSAKWGFAAAASTGDLKSLPVPVGCAGENGQSSRLADPNSPACSSDRNHTARTWFGDMIAIALLTFIPMFLAWLWVRRIGRPKRAP